MQSTFHNLTAWFDSDAISAVHMANAIWATKTTTKLQKNIQNKIKHLPHKCGCPFDNTYRTFCAMPSGDFGFHLWDSGGFHLHLFIFISSQRRPHSKVRQLFPYIYLCWFSGPLSPCAFFMFSREKKRERKLPSELVQ